MVTGSKEVAMSNLSTITARGQTTVPARVRAALNAVPGTQLAWHLTGDGTVIVRAKNRSIKELAGILGSESTTVSTDDMKVWRR
ncbi:AbrB/MazE/SpoVT family DNA-binding domain-containing protein [Paraburkholderia terrae]